MSLATNVRDLAQRVATEAKALRTLLNGNQAGLGGLATTDKSNLVAAINEVAAAIATASGIDDTQTSASSSWSSTKTEQQIQAAVAALVGAAPSDRDTLQELGQLLADEGNAITAINTALGVRVRVDAAQTFTAQQQAQGRANLGAAAAADLGDPDVDLVGTFNAGLA